MMIKNRAIMFVSVLIALSVAVCAFAFSDDVSAESTFGGGAGTESSPYLISSVAHLQQLATDVNGGTDYSGKYFKLTNDIDLSNVESWTPIGTTDKPFKGKFDGNNHSITGLKITRNLSGGETTVTKMYQGLFGATSSVSEVNSVVSGYNPNTAAITEWSEKEATAVLKNIVFENVNVSVQGQVAGVLVGIATNTYIENIEVKSGSITTAGNSGGIAGFISGSVLKNVSTGTGFKIESLTDGGYSFGGLVGAVREVGSKNAIIDSVNNADVTVTLTTAAASGILGNVAHSNNIALVYNCVNNGNVTITVKSASTSDSKYYSNSATGIIGQSNGQDGISIIKCTNNGKINNSGSAKAGSLAGIANYISGKIVDCNNTGEVTGSAYIRSGIIGCSTSSNSLIIAGETKNTGTVSSGNDVIVAEIIGENGSTYIVKSMEFDSADGVEKYIPISARSSIKFMGITCPEGTVDYNPSAVGYNITITVENSFLGSTFRICKGDMTTLYSDGSVDVSFKGKVDGITYVYAVGTNITVPDDCLLTEFCVFGSSNTVNLLGDFTNSVRIGSTENGKSSKNIINVADTVKIENHGFYVYGDSNTISNSGRINNSTSNHGMAVTGNNNIVINESKGFINHYLSVKGTNNKIDNFGQIMKISFVGTGEIINEKNGKIEGTSTDNYNGHKINVGTSKGEEYIPTKVTIHNYGLIEGLNDGKSSSYIFYTAGFDEVNWYNHKDSMIKKTRYLFCFQQKDGGTARGECKMNFWYAKGTVVDNSGKEVTIDDSVFYVSTQGTVAKYGPIKEISVTFNNSKGTSKTVIYDEGSKVTKPADPTSSGFVFGGWYKGDKRWDFSTSLTEDITLEAKWIADSGKITVPYDDGGIDFVIPVSPAATAIEIELSDDVRVTIDRDTIVSAAGKNITAAVTDMGSDKFEITVKEDGVAMNRLMNITLPCDSTKGTPSVYYYPASGGKVLMETVDSTSSTITFATVHNSVYGIVYTSTPAPTPTPIPTPSGGGSTTVRFVSSADGGSNVDAGIIIAIVTLVFSLLLLAYVIRKN